MGVCPRCGGPYYAVGGCINPVCESSKVEGKPQVAVNIQHFETGAIRSKDADSVRYDLITPIGLRRLAETYAEGAAKYGDTNWQKGIPAADCLNHAIRHIEIWKSGDRSEDHLAHAVWNLMSIMHFEELLPDMLNSLAYRKDTSNADKTPSPAYDAKSGFTPLNHSLISTSSPR